MSAIHWTLIILEVVLGTLLTAAGMANGLWTALSSPTQPGVAQPIRWRIMVGRTAPWPRLVTLLFGWVGPQPHGSFWLTMLTGVASTVVGCYLTVVGFGYGTQGARILAVIGVSLPPSCTTLVYNLAWLLPNARLPAIDLM